MKKITLLILFLATSSIMASDLIIAKGAVQAHTEVFGDATINPKTTKLNSHLTMGKTIESIKGTIDISMTDLKSDNSPRDAHMIQTIETSKFPHATYTFNEVKKSAKGYTVNGILDFHGVQKPLTIEAEITSTNQSLFFSGKSSFLMSNYDVIPPKMFFLTVRDQVDLTIAVEFKKR